PQGPGTPQADIFSLGKVLYEISTGMDRRRFPELPEDLRDWSNRRAVVEFNEILLKACAKDSERRYQTTEQIAAELLLLQDGQSVNAKRALGKQWKLAKDFALVVLVLGLVIAGAILQLRGPKQHQPLSPNERAQKLYVQSASL